MLCLFIPPFFLFKKNILFIHLASSGLSYAKQLLKCRQAGSSSCRIFRCQVQTFSSCGAQGLQSTQAQNLPQSRLSCCVTCGILAPEIPVSPASQGLGLTLHCPALQGTRVLGPLWITLIWDSDTRGGCVCDGQGFMWEIFVTSAQFCCIARRILNQWTPIG